MIIKKKGFSNKITRQYLKKASTTSENKEFVGSQTNLLKNLKAYFSLKEVI